MKQIKHNTEEIYITSNGFNIEQNDARYEIVSNLASLPAAITLFGDGFSMMSDGSFVKANRVPIPNLPSLMSEYMIEAGDVSKTVADALNIFAVNIIYSGNLLNLDLPEWTLL